MDKRPQKDKALTSTRKDSGSPVRPPLKEKDRNGSKGANDNAVQHGKAG